MNEIKSLTVLLLFFIARLAVKAQTQENANVSEGGYGLVKTNMSLQYDYGWGALKDGLAARVSYQFLNKGHFTVSANARYTSLEVKFKEEELFPSQDNMPLLINPDIINLNGTHILAQLGCTSTFKTTLLHRPFMAMAMINTDGSQSGFDRISGIAMGLLMLRYNKNTQFGLGPLVMINTNSKLPAFIVFMYRHRFNEKWQVSLYGGIFDIQYHPTKDDLICLGADVDVKAFYFKPKADYLPEKCRFTSTSFRPLVKYKRRLIQNLYLEVMGGATLKMSSRINGVSGAKEWIDLDQKVAPFIQTSVSYGI